MKKLKKIFSLFLSVIFILSNLTIPTFADEIPDFLCLGGKTLLHLHCKSM